MNDLLRREEIAELLDAPLDRVKGWITRRDNTGFPDPTEGRGTKHHAMLWDREHVEVWFSIWSTTQKTAHSHLAKVAWLHRPVSYDNGTTYTVCATCWTDDNGEAARVLWPCPTALAAGRSQ